ncbi:hypothetical protein GGR53DRAFT_480917 [Hypoxylon sp. FL1150]|nr:hypothetical protein GGR53DRAFT_480917 [Hypoxylon sp. FL1150]
MMADDFASRLKAHRLSEQKRKEAQSIPFLSDELITSAVPHSMSDFKQPRLQRCPFDLGTIDLNRLEMLDGGLDGYNWKIFFSDQSSPYVLKIFWDTKPLEIESYFAAQRECQNNAILRMLEAALEEKSPIFVNAKPRTKQDAVDNTLAFASDGNQIFGGNTTPISSIPRMRKCFGWLKIDGHTIYSWPRKLHPKPYNDHKLGHRGIIHDEQHIAIIYEYVEEGENDRAVVDEVAKFLWLTGFHFIVDTSARNWKSGVLLDLSDIVHVTGYWWRRPWYILRPASRILS